MRKLLIGYLFVGCITGLVIIILFIITLPDGKLHITFCDVGQGDAVYILFPDGRDMVVDGGPNDRVLACLGNHMPFWDRHIDMVLMTHPQKDHMQGLISILGRYKVSYVLRSEVASATEGYKALEAIRIQKNIPLHFLTAGEYVRVGSTTLSFVWPSKAQIAKAKPSSMLNIAQGSTLQKEDVLGAQAPPGDLNDYSLVFFLRYGSFDAFFTGDADMRVEDGYRGMKLGDDTVEVLKVPHHGSKTGFSDAFIRWVHPEVAVVSTGRNNYGHPTAETLEKLRTHAGRVLRTDQVGDIEILSDGIGWQVIRD